MIQSCVSRKCYFKNSSKIRYYLKKVCPPFFYIIFFANIVVVSQAFSSYNSHLKH